MMYFGFDDITAGYGKKSVLQNLSIDVPRGSFVTLIGQNGCGKSTLLKTVTRTVIPTSGRVILEDRCISEYPKKKLARKIAYLVQTHVSPPDIDVRTLVSYGRYPYMRFGRSLTREDNDIIDRALAVTGLCQLKSRAVATLSGGELQRARIAMTVAQQAEILILDEPTTHLDIGYRIEVLELLKKLNRTMNITVLMALHDLDLAARYSDILYIIKDGGVYASGTPDYVITKNNLRDVFGIEARILRDAEHDCPYFIPNRLTKGDAQ